MLDTTRPSVERYLNYSMSKGYANFKHEMLMHFRNYATIEEAVEILLGTSHLQIGTNFNAFLKFWKRNNRIENFKASRDSFSSSRDGKGFKGIWYGMTESSYIQRKCNKLRELMQLSDNMHSIWFLIQLLLRPMKIQKLFGAQFYVAHCF